MDQRLIVESSPVPLAVVNGDTDRFVNLDYFDTVAYANLWESRCHRLNGLGTTLSGKRQETSIRYSNCSGRMSTPGVRTLVIKTDIQLAPCEDWESTFRSVGLKNPALPILMLGGFNNGWIEFEAGHDGSRKTKTSRAEAPGYLVEPQPSLRNRTVMKIFLKLKRYWGAIRWKMLIIFVFFSVISMSLVGCLAVAVLNVVIRRESAYLVEERIKVVVYEREEVIDSAKDSMHVCLESQSSSLQPVGHSDGVWPQDQVTVLPWRESGRFEPAWHDTGVFAGVVADRGHLEIRSFHRVERDGCPVILTARVALDDPFLKQLSNAAGLQIVDTRPALLGPYRAEEGIRGEIEANFVPGSRRPVPVVVVARNWQTGQLENWVVCQVRPTYSRTIEDLGHMGLRTASWVSPFAGIAVAFALVYAAGLLLAFRLSRRIVSVIDGLSHAALRVGKGDFSVRVQVAEQDQLGTLAASFNEMTQDLENLREQEKQRAVLERDIVLAHEAQQYLYPRAAPVLSGANVWGVAAPARIVSGDLYDFFSFSNSEVGLLCADVSGKGMPAALMTGTSAGSCARTVSTFR